jgi:branched-chain amino acid transport system substrate-binding protein
VDGFVDGEHVGAMEGVTMEISRRVLLRTAAITATLPRTPARAQTAAIKIGVLNDQSGPFRDGSGPTSVACVRQAVMDFDASGKRLDVEVVSADHQLKPDIGANIAREWFDIRGVDIITDVPNSAVALAVAQVAREKDKIVMANAYALALTGKQCSPNTLVWNCDTYMLAQSTGGAMVRAGGDTWFFITADYAFGHSLEEQTAALVTKAGGKVLGRVRHPAGELSDFASFLQQAQPSGAKVLGLANAAQDTRNCIIEAREFGLTRGEMRIAPLLMYITDVHALGLDVTQGLILTESFYWDLNDRTRTFTNRVRLKTPDNWPNMLHAGCYSAALHYLKVAADMGVAEAKKSGAATVAHMKKTPTDDDALGKGYIREDGRGVFPAYLFEVKQPSESKGPWDLYKLVATTPGEDAVRPLSEGGCSLVHR